MSEPKDHHYVPKSFFKPWQDNFKKVWVYEKNNGIVFPPYTQGTKSICVTKNLYSYSDDVEQSKRNIIESNLFSILDNDGIKVIQKLRTSNGLIDLCDLDMSKLSAFIASLRLRTPEVFNLNKKICEESFVEMLNETNEEYRDNNDIQTALEGLSLYEWFQKNRPVYLNNVGHNFLADFIGKYKFAKQLFKMKIAVVTCEEINLLTSDRPLIFISDTNITNYHYAMSIAPHKILFASTDKSQIIRFLNRDKFELGKKMNIATIQQANSKAFSNNNYSHSLRLFENRLGKFHYILPFADVDKTRDFMLLNMRTTTDSI